MQGINVAIRNGWFALSFVGAPLLTAVAAALRLAGDRSGGPGGILSGLGLHVSMLLITLVVSVPLNERLATTPAAVTTADRAAARQRFERTWTRWNLVRTLTSTAAFACLVTAALGS